MQPYAPLPPGHLGEGSLRHNKSMAPRFANALPHRFRAMNETRMARNEKRSSPKHMLIFLLKPVINMIRRLQTLLKNKDGIFKLDAIHTSVIWGWLIASIF